MCASLSYTYTQMMAKAQEIYDIKKHAVLYTIKSSSGDNNDDDGMGQALSAEKEVIPEDFLKMTSLEETTRADQRLGSCLQQPVSKRDLKPLRKPLFTKRSRRCRKDVNEGR